MYASHWSALYHCTLDWTKRSATSTMCHGTKKHKSEKWVMEFADEKVFGKF